jgi:hypothetical protein
LTAALRVVALCAALGFADALRFAVVLDRDVVPGLGIARLRPVTPAPADLARAFFGIAFAALGAAFLAAALALPVAAFFFALAIMNSGIRPT